MIKIGEKMKNNKTDQRSKYTCMTVKKSLLKLLQEKELKNITVAELCREADINRGTFYNHFYDIFDVYESIETEFCDEIKTRLAAIKAYELNDDFFKEITFFIAQNVELTSIVIKTVEGGALLKTIIAFVRDKYVSEFIEHDPTLPKSRVESVFTYTTNGSIGILVEWITGGMAQTPNQIAELIGKFNTTVIDKFLQK